MHALHLMHHGNLDSFVDDLTYTNEEVNYVHKHKAAALHAYP